jgi:hypothetical protein
LLGEQLSWRRGGANGANRNIISGVRFGCSNVDISRDRGGSIRLNSRRWGVVSEKIDALKFAKATGDIPENVNFAIKTGAVRDFLDNSVVSYQTSEPGVELKTAQITSNARAFTLLISCTANEAELGKK